MKSRSSFIAFFVGFVALICSIGIGYLTYSKSISDAEVNLYHYFSDKAQSLHTIVELNAEKPDSTILKLIELAFENYNNKPADEYICIVDKNSNLILHSKHPHTVGNNAGKNLLLEEGTVKCTLDDIVQKAENFVGGYIASGGESQIAAFNYVDSKNWTLGVHRSKQALLSEIKFQYKWLIVAFIIVNGVLVPLSLVALFGLTTSEAKRKIKNEKIIQDQLKESKEILEKRDAKYNAMISNISDVIAIIDKNGIIKYKSPNIEIAFGWKPEELYEKDCWFTVHPDDLERIQKEFMALLQLENTPKTVEYRYLCKDKNYKQIELTAVNLVNDPLIDGILMSYHDISIKKDAEDALRASEYKHRILFENMQDAVCMLDNDGNIIDINQTGIDLYGYTREEMIGMNVSELVYQDDKDLSDSYFAKLEKDGFYRMYEGRVKTKTGKLVWIQVNSTEFIENGVKVGMQDIIRDITERKISEEKILKQNNQLLKLNATKDKFFSIISHDHRNPFNALLGYSSLLLNSGDMYDSSEQKEIINFIHQGLQDTYKLLENLLMWSRAQSGDLKSNPEELNLFLLVHNTINLLSNAALNKEIKVTNEISKDVTVYADKTMALIIIRNLVSNAIKFTPQNGSVSVKAEIKNDEQKQSLVEISVIDSGVGISDDLIPNLFTVYENKSTLGTEKESGTGLGLILCKEFVVKNKGEIRVKSEPEKGSCFTFTLPVNGF